MDERHSVFRTQGFSPRWMTLAILGVMPILLGVGLTVSTGSERPRRHSPATR